MRYEKSLHESFIIAGTIALLLCSWQSSALAQKPADAKAPSTAEKALVEQCSETGTPWILSTPGNDTPRRCPDHLTTLNPASPQGTTPQVGVRITEPKATVGPEAPKTCGEIRDHEIALAMGCIQNPQ